MNLIIRCNTTVSRVTPHCLYRDSSTLRFSNLHLQNYRLQWIQLDKINHLSKCQKLEGPMQIPEELIISVLPNY